MELDTALAEHELSRRQGGTMLPSNIDQSASAVFCFDNNDLCEGTRSGGNTTHCTNGIIIQRQRLTGPPASTRNMQAQRRSTRYTRSLRLTTPSLPAPYFSSDRCSPPMTVDPDLLDSGTEYTESVRKAKVLDFAWLLARLLQEQSICLRAEEQLVPAWSGFNAQLR